MVLERNYQARLIRTLRRIFPDGMILKNDSDYMQGVPDLILLVGPRWAMLEVKASADSRFQPNQEFYVEQLNRMGFAAVIYPEIEEEVLRDLQQALQPRRSARVSQRQ